MNTKIIRIGFYYRSSDRQSVPRFYCHTCQHSFGKPSLCYNQKKRHLNHSIFHLLASGVTMRRIAILLKIHRITVARRLTFLGALSETAIQNDLSSVRDIEQFQMDELETFEHTKCKPLSVAMAVTQERKILGFTVAMMPAKGLLAKPARKKYGYRKDERPKALKQLLSHLARHVEVSTILSDSNPLYPGLVKKFFPKAQHERVISRRSCVTGQGELKKTVFDPIFSLNHTFAMLRANISRLIRKTWSTTKKREALYHHLAIYAVFHNRFLTTKVRPGGISVLRNAFVID